jgi:HD-like signal output (HDOD) protein/GGDEF domain-containing protein
MQPSSQKLLPGALARAEDLPSLPAVAVEVLRLCREEETTLDDLAEVLAHDPALSARLLRFANSSLYNLGDEVRTLQRAALVLGMKTVQLMSLSFSLVSSLPREGTAGSFDYRTFWRRSLVRAVTARSLASRVGSLAQDEAFLCGLLAEIGQLVLARCLPREYEPVLRAAQAARVWPGPELEQSLLGFDQTDVSESLLRSWQLPGVIGFAIGAQARPAGPGADTPGEVRELVHVLSVASAVTELLIQERGSEALERVETLAAQHFQLSPAELHEFLVSLEAPIQETAELLSMPLPPGKSPETLLEEARAELLARTAARADVPLPTDPVTGLAPSEACTRFLEQEVRSRLQGSSNRPLGVLCLAIERFAELARGSADSGAALERIAAQVLRGHTRRCDFCARLSPGSFALILGEASPRRIRALAERLRAEIAARASPGGAGETGPGVCIGAVCLGRPRTLSDARVLLEVAQRLLARAQARGAGAIEVHPTLIQPR